MPPSHRNIQTIPLVKYSLHIPRISKEWKLTIPLQVVSFNIHQTRIAHIDTTALHATRILVPSLCRAVQPNVLLPDDLAEDVVIRIGVERRYCTRGSEPCVEQGVLDFRRR